MGADGPVVRFVVPARNEERFLARTLESLETLPEEPACETIVVDGGSTDGTPEVARQFDTQLVRAHGWEITAKNGEDGGARFEIRTEVANTR